MRICIYRYIYLISFDIYYSYQSKNKPQIIFINFRQYQNNTFYDKIFNGAVSVKYLIPVCLISNINICKFRKSESATREAGIHGK